VSKNTGRFLYRAADDREMATATTPIRQALIRQGQRLEYNSAEGLVSIVAGLIAGSVSLVGFGLEHHRSGVRGGSALAAPSRSRPFPP